MVMYITLDKGTMFGGKSSRLWKYYRYYSKKDGIRMLVINHIIDTRYGTDNIVTHDGNVIPSISLSCMSSIDPTEWDCILIDEGQFYPDLYDWVKRWFLLCDTKVHIAGLNGDKEQNSFGDINRLSPYCSEERVHYGMCEFCGDPAPFTLYRGDSSTIINVDGIEQYYTVCVNHLSHRSK